MYSSVIASLIKAFICTLKHTAELRGSNAAQGVGVYLQCLMQFHEVLFCFSLMTLRPPFGRMRNPYDTSFARRVARRMDAEGIPEQIGTSANSCTDLAW